MRHSHSGGFTLIELLVVVGIVGILTAVAVPQYQGYRARAFDVRALQDLRSIAVAEEAYYLENETYLSCVNDGCTALPGIARISAGVTCSIEGNSELFTGEASHETGSGRVYRWDSSAGGLLE